MKYDAFVFDFDGTIAESGLGITNCVRYAFEKMGRPVPEAEVLRRFIGPPLVHSFQEYGCMTGEEAEQATAFYRERFGLVGVFELDVYAGIPALLATLRDMGARVVVASGKPEVFLRKILNHFDLIKYFDAVAGPGMQVHSADKSDHVRAVLGDVDPARACMIGDRRFDMDAGVQLGMHNVGVAFGYGSREELETSGAHFVADSVQALAEHLLEGAPVRRGRRIVCDEARIPETEALLKQWGFETAVNETDAEAALRAGKIVLEAAVPQNEQNGANLRLSNQEAIVPAPGASPEEILAAFEERYF